MDVAELLEDLARVPHLPGAKCRGKSELYDRTVPGAASRPEVAQARHDALQICGACPCLSQCSAWIDTLPPWYRPRAVVAGRINTWLETTPPGMPLRRTRWSSA